MIGPASLALETAPVVFGLVLVVYGAVRAARRQSGGIPLLGTGLIFALLMGIRYVVQWRAHLYLDGLAASSVRSVRVGPTHVTDAAAVREIVRALRHRQWFSSNHGGWDVPLQLVIEDGRAPPVRITVAFYHREEGAVLSFSRGGGWADGYAFCSELPEALARAGAPLPGPDP